MSDIILLDELWVRVLADFTFELCEVIGDGCFVLLHHHLRLDPSLEAVDVNDGAASFAAARRNEKVFIILVLPQANFTLPS